MVLGVLDGIPSGEASGTFEPRVAGDFPEFALEGMPITDSIDWSSVWLESAPPDSAGSSRDRPDSPSVLVG